MGVDLNKQAHWQDFIEKCAEHGVDPRALVKAAGLPPRPARPSPAERLYTEGAGYFQRGMDVARPGQPSPFDQWKQKKIDTMETGKSMSIPLAVDAFGMAAHRRGLPVRTDPVGSHIRSSIATGEPLYANIDPQDRRDDDDDSSELHEYTHAVDPMLRDRMRTYMTLQHNRTRNARGQRLAKRYTEDPRIREWDDRSHFELEVPAMVTETVAEMVNSKRSPRQLALDASLGGALQSLRQNEQAYQQMADYGPQLGQKVEHQFGYAAPRRRMPATRRMHAPNPRIGNKMDEVDDWVYDLRRDGSKLNKGYEQWKRHQGISTPTLDSPELQSILKDINHDARDERPGIRGSALNLADFIKKKNPWGSKSKGTRR